MRSVSRQRYAILLLSFSVSLGLAAGGCSSDSTDEAGAGATPDAGVDGDAAPVPIPIPAPTAKIEIPAANMWTSADSARVVGTASPAAGGGVVTSVTVNGVAATTKDAFAHWTADVPLKPGKNALVVEVKDDKGTVNAKAAEASVESKVMFRGRIANVRVSDGQVYVIDSGTIVALPQAGGGARVVAKASSAITAFTIDGNTIFLTTLKSEVATVPKAGGTPTVIFNSNTGGPTFPGGAVAAVEVSGANVFVLLRTGAPVDLLRKIPKAGGPSELVSPLDVDGDYPLDTINDAVFVNDSFVATMPGVKPISIPTAGGLITKVNIVKSDAGGDLFPNHIGTNGGSLHVTFPEAATTATVYTTALAGGALTATNVKVSSDVSDMTVAGTDVYTAEGRVATVAKYALAGGASTRLSEGLASDYAFAGAADDTEAFIATPAGITAYSRSDGTKRKVYEATDLTAWVGPQNLSLAVLGDTIYATQGTKVFAISKTTGTSKTLISAFDKPDMTALGIAVDATKVYVLKGLLVEVYDATTGAYGRDIPPAGDGSFSITTQPGGIAVDGTNVYVGHPTGLSKVAKADPGAGSAPEWTKVRPAEITAVAGIALAGDTIWASTTNGFYGVKLATGDLTTRFDGTNKPAIWTRSVPLAVDATKGVIAFDSVFRRVQVADFASGAAYFLP